MLSYRNIYIKPDKFLALRNVAPLCCVGKFRQFMVTRLLLFYRNPRSAHGDKLIAMLIQHPALMRVEFSFNLLSQPYSAFYSIIQATDTLIKQSLLNLIGISFTVR